MNNITIEQYNASRDPGQTYRICHVPFRSMFLGPDGRVNPCCANRTYVYGKYPEESLHEIWFGENAKKFREYILQNDLSNGCDACSQNILLKSFDLVAAKPYDQMLENLDYPSHIDFNLSNICNLECVMCYGWASSSIIKNRYGLKAPENPYKEKFLEEIQEFLPHLKSAFYIGGEPFLIPVFYELWEATLKINPACTFFIQTNATVLNDRIKELLERGNFFLNVSIDSLHKDTFESIRANANFEKTMENLDYFIEYSIRKETNINLTVCPLQQNMEEIPALVEFANKRNIKLFFNTVLIPHSHSFFGLDRAKINELIAYYSSFSFPAKNENHATRASLVSLIGQMKHFYSNDEYRKKYQEYELVQIEKLRLAQKEQAEVKTQQNKYKALNQPKICEFFISEISNWLRNNGTLHEKESDESRLLIIQKLKLLEEFEGEATFSDILCTIYNAVPLPNIVNGLLTKNVKELHESYLACKNPLRKSIEQYSNRTI